jgi:hypothetical protein
LFVTEETEQLSAVIGVPKPTLNAVQLVFAATVKEAGALIVGLVLSVTVTNWFAVVELPAASVTVQVTVVFPIGNVAGALFVTDATLQLSEVTGVPKATPVAEHAALVLMLRFAGAVIEGAITSETTTCCTAVLVFPFPSEKVHVIE